MSNAYKEALSHRWCWLAGLLSSCPMPAFFLGDQSILQRPPSYCRVPERPGQERQEGSSSSQRLKQHSVPFALKENDQNTDNPEPIKSSQCLIEVVSLLATALSTVLNVIKIVLMTWSHDGVHRLYAVIAIVYSLIS